MKNTTLNGYLHSLEQELQGCTESEKQTQIEELRQHLESLTESYQNAGESREQAEMSALNQFGREGEREDATANKICQKMASVNRPKPFYFF